MVTTERFVSVPKQPILSTSTTSSSPQVHLATSPTTDSDNRNNHDRDARNENKTEICHNFGRGYCRWGTNCRFIHASPKGTNNPRPNSSQHNTRSMQQGPGHTGLNSASQQHLLPSFRPNKTYCPRFQQTQPHQPTFRFNGHQQALYSAVVQNQSASSGSTSQETQLPHAFNTLTLQDPANSNWNMDTDPFPDLATVRTMVTTEEMRLRSVLLATSQPRIQDNRNNRDRDARNENKTEICRNFGRVFPYGSMTPHDSPSYTFLDTSPNIIHQHIISKLTSASPLPTTTITSTAAPPSPPRSPLQPAHQTHESSPLPHSPNVQPTSNASTETTIPTHNHNNPTSTHPMVTRFRVGTNRPTQRFNLHVSTISPIPKSYPIAFRDPNWYRAMLDEYTALIKNNTWILVPRPPDANIVRSMWLFRHKYNADGTLSRYKARLVANGRAQLAGIDVDETFSPVVKPATIRTVLSLAISRHWPVHQLDVKNAFLHGSLSETVYMHQPPGFRDPQHPDHVCLLQRSLYGLKQAPPGLGADTAYLLLYVDDIVLTASSSDLLQQIITSLHAEFSMTDLGSLNYFLGISVTRNASGMFLSQQKYATEVLDRAGMRNCKPCRTPVDTDSKLSADGAPISDSTLYRSLAGALQYLTFTRPDISYAVQQVCLFMHDPREPHLSALKRILRYVRGTLSYGLQLYSSTTSSLVAYSDADWAAPIYSLSRSNKWPKPDCGLVVH
ncbi:ribonuclease H-like domain-containing protein [Tanacetum coccineum]|uniref:Ribonuclease H-like domain-containing protein n=1 Tax=Tanacetum coccineum TaxID=301880 RepID=A0ABQ5H7W8_9ASTR